MSDPNDDPMGSDTPIWTPLVEGLNPAQAEAVVTIEGPVLVVAGAGSGKTRVLTHRIAHLIRDHHVDPFSILAITFTNKAANEMVERVGELVGSGLSRAMWVTTFHKACVRILRREITRLGYRSAFTIYDQADSIRLLRQIIKDLGIDDKRVTPRSVKHEISRAKDELVDFESYAARAGDHVELKVAEIYKEYEERLRKASAFDFDDLIVKVVEIFQLFPQVLAHWQERFAYVMVDEYQDTNRAQYHLVNMLAAGHRNVMVVGDHDQCLPGDTRIATPQGQRRIDEIEVGDLVTSALGGGTSAPAAVTAVSRTTNALPLWEATTTRGVIRATAWHRLPARLVALPGRWLTYLMYREDRGYRIGVTTGSRPPSRSVPEQPGFVVRANQERADGLWILDVSPSRGRAAMSEAYFAAEYGLPTTVFHGHGRKLVTSEADITELFERLDTHSRAKQMMHELELDPELPHYRPTGGSRRSTINLTMFSDRRTGDPVGYHRIQWSSSREDIADRLRRQGFNVRSNGKGGWRVETSRKSYRAALALAEEIAEAAGLSVNHRMSIGGAIYDLHPVSHLRPGMRVLSLDSPTVEEVEVTEVRRGPASEDVYDLTVAGTHNYVADGHVVHNSIYRFRGATVQNLMDFELDYPEAAVIPLVQNYRSTQNILDAANAVIRNNTTRKAKELWTQKGSGAELVRYEADDEHDEAAFIAEEVERLRREDGCRFGDVAVFYRTNAQSRVLEEVFVRVGTPYRVIGGVRFYERREIKDILAYLRLLVNPDDDVSARRVLNTPRRGIGDKTEASIDHRAKRQGIAFLAAAQQAEHIPTLGPRAVGAVREFTDLITLLRTQLVEGGMDVAELIEQVWSRTGYMSELQSERTIEALGREENLRELKSVAQEHHERTGALEPLAALESFLESVTLVSEQDELEGDEPRDEGQVTFMTLHNAKGLEFPVVFVVGLEDGVFPHVRSLGDSAELEEERRLCYVGLTRAQERLYVTYAGHRRLWGGASYNPPSRFLRELPDGLVEARSAKRGGSAAKRVRDKEVLSFDGEEFRVGDRVLHPRLGEGIIVGLAGEGERSEATVDFTDEGRRQLLLAYAPIVRT
ncbi:MAG TPA: UvrD-helicase domain-containing protein [Nitriliruptorales bacterium]